MTMNREIRKVLILVFAIGFCAKAIASDDDSISADRPGMVSGTHAVTPGNMYIEMGYHYSFSDISKTSSLPLANIRFGIIERVEMSVSWAGLHFSHDTDHTDFALPALGGKYRIIMDKSFNLTLVGGVSLVENDGYKAEPSLALAWDYHLGDKFSLLGTHSSQYTNNDFEFLNVLGFHYALFHKTGFFSEYYLAGINTDHMHHGVEYGFVYLLNNNLQVDIFGGHEFGHDIGHYLGCGIAKRF